MRIVLEGRMAEGRVAKKRNLWLELVLAVLGLVAVLVAVSWYFEGDKVQKDAHDYACLNAMTRNDTKAYSQMGCDGP